jgi:hypothetical protein
MAPKEILSLIAIGITLAAFYPYIRGILSGSTKPHVFSWVIWASTTLVVFFAQLEAQGGVGAWPIGVSGSITALIAFLAYLKRSDISITSADWAFFVAAMASLPLWYLTADPTWAVVVLTAVDILGFGPTLRKAYAHPHAESIPFFFLFAIRNALVVLALERHSIATVLFPAAVSLACLVLIGVIIFRRQRVPASVGHP